MRSATLFGLAVGLVLPMSVGCMSQQGVLRGQSPAEATDSRVTPAGGFYGDTSGGVEQVGLQSPLFSAGGPVAIRSSLAERIGCSSCRGAECPSDCEACPRCGDCPERCSCLDGCRGPACCHQGYSGAWYPTHHHWFDYDPPRDLVYPPANVPPATIVYPYYTCKGPDDFFKTY